MRNNMKNVNSNNSITSFEQTSNCVPSISRYCDENDDDERTLLENETIRERSSVQVNDEVVTEAEGNRSVTEEDEKKSRPYTRKQKITFAGIAFVYIADYALYSVLAPFFPVEAQKKGISTSVSGLVFGVYALVSFIVSPIAGKYVAQIGSKFMFFSGTFLNAGCTILFGVIGGIEDPQTFIIYCFVLRSVEAVGASCSITAAMTMVATLFPDNVAQMEGLLEMCAGLGLMIGPALGGVMYKVGGYRLPFLVLGSVDILVCILTMLIIPNMSQSEGELKPGSLLKFMMIPVLWPMSLGIIIASAAMTFLDPTLSLHLETFGVSTSVAGVLFLLIGGFYGLTMPLWGYLADKKGRTRLMTLLGFYLMGLSYMFIGPSPLLNLPHYLWIVILALSLSGLSIGLACMPLFIDMMVSARWYGFPDDMSTNGLVSGVFGGCFSLGNFIGPVLGGILKDSVGFSWASTYIAASCFAFILIFGAFCIWEYQWGKGRRKPWRYFGEPQPASENNHNHVTEPNHVQSSVPRNPTSNGTSINVHVHDLDDNSVSFPIDNCLGNGPWVDRYSDTEPLVVNA